MYHKVVLRLELWQGKVSDCYYLIDPKDSRYWDLKRTMMPTHDFMECFIRDNANTTCIYANLPGCMHFIGEVLFNVDDVTSPIVADETVSITEAINIMDTQFSQQGESVQGMNKRLYGDCPNPDVTASGIMQEGLAAMLDRASERDNDGERSMLACVKAFNALYGLELSETQGWMFMMFLKMSRANGGSFQRDDYVDLSAYAALAGECASKEVK
jgi:hypothetical protein